MIDLAEKVLKGDVRAIARAISWIENNRPEKENLIDALFPHCGNAQVWGITGPPGAGKSTLLDKIIEIERRKQKKVAVIAVDPSSPFSGGAILGDRLRMQSHATDEGVFIRSMASRGHLGGVAQATSDAIKVLDAAGFDLIAIETIGVGQTEIEVVGLSDIVLLVLVPGLGDEIQAMKAGVMEIGDIFIVNKKDRDGALKLRAEIEYVLGIQFADYPEKMKPIVMTAASMNEGIEELLTVTDDYFLKISMNRSLQDKRKTRLKSEIRQIFTQKVSAHVKQKYDFENRLDEWVDAVYKKKKRPYSLINEKINLFLRECNWL
ncbi:MAG: methylmalonyl Co-A mutase-associated GTPase MeaB [Candidatus Marinimicrobia bacterium]|nr:methylmalonyl Co-A mutase-associated GTPase MeaB [Candidatus Neomarinimicrobiota bacterium]